MATRVEPAIAWSQAFFLCCICFCDVCLLKVLTLAGPVPVSIRYAAYSIAAISLSGAVAIIARLYVVALATDRVECPRCNHKTRRGRYCDHCRSELTPAT